MTAPLASLPMYDHPAVREATDALWQAIAGGLARRGVEAPAALDRRADYATIWEEPSLLLSQTCGYPYVTRLRGTVRLVATPCYAAPGCDGPLYRSVLVVRADDPARALGDLRGRRAAVNAADSQSGLNAFRALIAPLARDGRFFAGMLTSGGHAASAAMVAGDDADAATLDCVTWALIARHEPDLAARLRVLDWTPPAPGLPLVTASDRPDGEVEILRAVLAEVAADPALASARAALLLEGFEILPDFVYDRITRMEAAAATQGYPALA